MSKLEPRNLDHVVLPVPDLETARARYEALGFTVAPDGRHKFGTENCCVKFANGTFLEPLAIGHRETVEANALKGNNFLSRDAAYRFRNGDNGFSMVVFTGDDARSERKEFRKAGYKPGKLVTVKRPGVHARLAFALDERAPDFSMFLCQDVGTVSKSKPKLLKHENGALRISQVTLYEPVPSDFQYYLQTVSGQRDVRSHSFGMDQALPNGTLATLSADGLSAYYGIEKTPLGRGLRAMAVDIEVENLAAVSKLLKKNKIECSKTGARLVVPPAPGQGMTLAFVEAGK